MISKSQARISSCRVTGHRNDHISSCGMGKRVVMILYTLKKKMKSLKLCKMDHTGELMRKPYQLGGYWQSRHYRGLGCILVTEINVQICLDMEYILDIKLRVLTGRLNMGGKQRMKDPRDRPEQLSEQKCLLFGCWYGLNCVPPCPKSYVEALTPTVMVSGFRVIMLMNLKLQWELQEVIRVR